MLEVPVSRRALRERLWNPPGGRESSEIEIISAPEARRREFSKIVEQSVEIRARRRELFTALVDAHERTGFQFCTERPRDRPVTFDEIARAVCTHYGQTKTNVFSDRRKAKFVLPRQVIMYLSTEFTAMSFPMVGRLLGGRDHSTCIHGHRKIQDLLAFGDERLIADIAAIKAVLGVE